MLNESEPQGAARAVLSSLMDGDLAGGRVADAVGLWRQDASARSAWHAYHLIGDVLRSDDLANVPVRPQQLVPDRCPQSRHFVPHRKSPNFEKRSAG